MSRDWMKAFAPVPKMSPPPPPTLRMLTVPAGLKISPAMMMSVSAALSFVMLNVVLVALVLLYGVWFARVAPDRVALLVFGLPPLLCAFAVWRRARTAGLWSAVLALAWFSHGVLVAWIRPEERGLAWIELLLAVVVVLAASLPGLRARFGGRR